MRLVSAWHDTSWIELLAAALALAYVLLAIGQRLSCWIASFASSVLYIWVFFSARLYIESLLKSYFSPLAIYCFRELQPCQSRGGMHRAPPARPRPRLP